MQNALPIDALIQAPIARHDPQVDAGDHGKEDQGESEIADAFVVVGAEIDQGEKQPGGEEQRTDDLE
jgi:hypothetical protein